MKYLHVLFEETKVKFANTLIAGIKNPENGLDGNEHLFVTCSKSEYGVLKEYPAVEYFQPSNPRYASAEVINAYGEKFDWIFVHGMGPLSILKIRKRHLKKIIWRTWGFDIGLDYEGSLLKKLVKWGYNKTVFKHFVKSIRAIGVANIVDKIAIEKLIGGGVL